MHKRSNNLYNVGRWNIFNIAILRYDMYKLVLTFITVAFLFIVSVNVSAHRMGQGHGMRGMMHTSMIRHHYIMRHGIGSEYSSLENTLVGNEENLNAGKVLYEENCSRCHGASGYGDGPAGNDLNPRPANIANIAKMPMATDGYLFWSISEGGIPIQTAMPAFKGSLSEEEIWKIIIYLREM